MSLTRRQFLSHSLMITAGASISGCYSTSKKVNTAPKNPNIIYILADDLGYGDLGCYGQKQIKTPNIDKMAAEGMKFTQHYAGSTVCAPSRCTLMTGLHTGHCRIKGNEADSTLFDTDVTVAEICKKAGYRTAAIGKWGLGEAGSPGIPNKQGFDYFYGYLNQVQAHNYYPEYLWENQKKDHLENIVERPDISQYDQNDPGALEYGHITSKFGGISTNKKEYSHDLFTEKAIEFIENSNEPFFLYLPYTIPHANNEFDKIGIEHGMEVPDNGMYSDKPWPNAQKSYAAMISKLDSDVGRIIELLKEKNIEENTLVIFASDNGPHTEGGSYPEFFNSNGSLRGMKRDLYEGGIRIPFIAYWPGKIESGTQSDHISAFWDFLPTVADITGQPIESPTDGISMLPTLLGQPEEQKQHKYLYWQYKDKRAVRMNNWKAVKIAEQASIELYDISKDISELNDIASQHPDICSNLKSLLATPY
ncbi:MAG: arylsulfatase [Sedimentisphaeraceae bacterium JB056]